MMLNRKPTNRISLAHVAFSQRGFSMVEALASLVVLSIGMLGIASLYVEGLKAGRTALYRSAAIELAADMMDRIRANPSATDDYELAAATGTVCINGTVDCDDTAIARSDILMWETDVATRMPTGTTTNIAVDTTVPLLTGYTITLSWPEPGYAANLTYTMIARL